MSREAQRRHAIDDWRPAVSVRWNCGSISRPRIPHFCAYSPLASRENVEVSKARTEPSSTRVECAHVYDRLTTRAIDSFSSDHLRSRSDGSRTNTSSDTDAGVGAEADEPRRVHAAAAAVGEARGSESA